MIVIDMDMPKNCVNCNINCRHKVTAHIRYSQGQFEIPQDCPIKYDIEDIKKERYNNGFYDGYKRATEQANAVIEDIKAEIKSIQKEDMECDGCSDMGMVLDIIDRQTTEK